ncbi:uncharacterized protein LOC130724075 [Lotus japonicus]|uniref:uncharacterized protein LOC130724075 n=1 Tax=Lotus japonicus TaxID=34305 RepID=UPI0025873C44|nr:uncharacterized protein LOC130724075 [Lotus japonicus]XP_057431228.1 uncharacterized protein LOC130724075 [Lotus japonicus]XP_057431229.1 uncharacterized protein LOC130724075 [Lotus japonicus]
MQPAADDELAPALMAAIDARFATMAQQLSSSMESTVSTLLDQMAHLSTQAPPRVPPQPPPGFEELQPGYMNPPLNTPSAPPHPHSTPIQSAMKLQLNPFDGSEPNDWLFHAEQFFRFHKTPPDQRLSIMSFYMRGEALSWFKWLYNNKQLSTWEEFNRALVQRFGPSCYENPQQELFKLQQTSTVQEYQTKFEKLCNQVVGLPPDIILDCFLSGLNPEILQELKVFRPYSVHHAIGLAKLIESKHKPPTFKPFKYTPPNHSPSQATVIHNLPRTTPAAAPSKPTSSTPPLATSSITPQPTHQRTSNLPHFCTDE